MSPEIVERQPYGKPADVWSAGGPYPFMVLKNGSMILFVKQDYILNTPMWEPISEHAKDLDRDKYSSRIHLHLTVEEMRKMNARRKLKGAVLAAVSSPRWSNFFCDAGFDPYLDVTPPED
ncbi:Peripheral plasma membrane protein CASK, partial [Armadillidium vulgare]